MVDRVDILAALEDAAQAVGLPAARFKPHSLRIGGASALYHATGEIETVKRSATLFVTTRSFDGPTQ